jgi:hypothetical protein
MLDARVAIGRTRKQVATHALLPSCRHHRCPLALLGGVVAHVLGDLHRAEVRAAHRAEVRELVRVLGQRLVVELLGLLRIEAEVELVLPAELEARLGQRVVAHLRAGWPLARSAAWAAIL